MARLIIAHQILNCLSCKQLDTCTLTKSLTEMALSGSLDPDAVESMNSCGTISVREIINLIRRAGSNDFTNKLLITLMRRRMSRKVTGLYSFKEGSIVNVGDFLLIIDNEGSKTTSTNFSLSYELKVSDNGCAVIVNRFNNNYLDYLLGLVSKVVPDNEYSIYSLLSSREKFLSLFINDERVASSLLLTSFGLGDLTPFLLDQDIEDIYITQDFMYINHVKYGNCKVLNTNPQLLAKQLLKLANISGVRVSVDNPSGKFSLNIGSRRVRVVIDRWPLVEGIAVHIRLHKKPFTISDLVALGTIDSLNASKLVLAARNGYGILIMGPPSSGKTTLLNAIDMAIPLQLRRIYVDEVDESLELPAPSVKVKSLMGKVEEVLKSLHRGYGILIIGELREREHFEAFVHGANAGLQVLATTHANDVQSLLDRLRVFHLNDVIDLGKYVLITMEKMSSVRRVKSIIYPQGFNPDPEQVSAISTIIIKLGKIKDYVSYTMQLNKLINEPPGDQNEH